MNDFTKEELQWILSAINIFMHESITESIGRPIADKIQAMIDNYFEPECNHQWKASSQTIQIEAFNGEIFDYCPLKINCKLCGVSYFQ